MDLIEKRFIPRGSLAFFGSPFMQCSGSLWFGTFYLRYFSSFSHSNYWRWQQKEFRPIVDYWLKTNSFNIHSIRCTYLAGLVPRALIDLYSSCLYQFKDKQFMDSSLFLVNWMSQFKLQSISMVWCSHLSHYECISCGRERLLLP